MFFFVLWHDAAGNLKMSEQNFSFLCFLCFLFFLSIVWTSRRDTYEGGAKSEGFSKTNSLSFIWSCRRPCIFVFATGKSVPSMRPTQNFTNGLYLESWLGTTTKRPIGKRQVDPDKTMEIPATSNMFDLILIHVSCRTVYPITFFWIMKNSFSHNAVVYKRIWGCERCTSSTAQLLLLALYSSSLIYSGLFQTYSVSLIFLLILLLLLQHGFYKLWFFLYKKRLLTPWVETTD